MIGPRRVRLYPIYHPAAALYTPAMLETLRADFRAHPGAAGARRAPEQPEPVAPSSSCPSRSSSSSIPEPELVYDEQLGLF